jgi:hypothetical protein
MFAVTRIDVNTQEAIVVAQTSVAMPWSSSAAASYVVRAADGPRVAIR